MRLFRDLKKKLFLVSNLLKCSSWTECSWGYFETSTICHKVLILGCSWTECSWGYFETESIWLRENKSGLQVREPSVHEVISRRLICLFWQFGFWDLLFVNRVFMRLFRDKPAYPFCLWKSAKNVREPSVHEVISRRVLWAVPFPCCRLAGFVNRVFMRLFRDSFNRNGLYVIPHTLFVNRVFMRLFRDWDGFKPVFLQIIH